MMQIFAEMNDSLGFVSCLKERNQSDVPENLLETLTFTEQSEIASTWAESFLDQQTTDDRKIKIISMFEEMGNLERAKEIFNQLSPQALNTPRASILQARLALADKDYPAAIEVLEAVKAKLPRGLGPITSRMTQAEIGFLLSRAYDKLGQYDSAWAAAADAHTAKPEAFDVDQFESEAERIMAFFTRDRPEPPHWSFGLGNPRLEHSSTPSWGCTQEDGGNKDFRTNWNPFLILICGTQIASPNSGEKTPILWPTPTLKPSFRVQKANGL